MQSDYAASLLRSGIIEAKVGDKVVARHYLERVINIGGGFPVLAEAWFWLNRVSDDPDKKREMLKNCLSYDLHHARARRDLALLDGKLKLDEVIDPNALPTASTNPEKVGAERFMCPKCGARMVYAPDGKSLICEHCTSGVQVQAIGDAKEQDFLIAMATARGHRKPVALQVFHCQGCGAEFILSPDRLSITCAYCDSPYVVSTEAARKLVQPDGIIPQAFDQKHTARLLADWVEQNSIMPESKVDDLRGVYLPAWTFDIGGELDYSGDLIQAEGELFNDGRNHVHIKDSYPVHIDDLCLPASHKFACQLDRFLPTFDLKAIRPYDPRYLANWPAKIYDVPMSNVSLDARSRAYAQLKRSLPADIASLHNLKTSSANLTIESFKLILLPVWITEILMQEEKHLVLINGQTGIVQGDTPSKPKADLLDWLNDLLED